MNKLEIRKGIYYVGVTDWNIRSFHGYSTNRGATYNAYLIVDEKITLIDTVKATFAGELLERICEIVNPEDIDYVVCNHVEMDHSGALPEIMKHAVNATVITSDPAGLKGLAAHYGADYQYEGVKAGDILSLGERTLTFVATPMLHWPDNMVTYCPEEKILFSNDAFGQHYASGKRLDVENNISIIMEEAKKYYANILMPYGKQATKAIEIVKGLSLDMIAPSHGVIWTKYISDIISVYEEYANGTVNGGAVVVYDSMWGSTQKMAMALTEGFRDAGIDVKVYDLKTNHISDIMTEVLTAEYICVGSPTLNGTMLPTVAAFLCYMKGLAPKNKKGIAFGSYGWNGKSIMEISQQLQGMGMEQVIEPVKAAYIPEKEQLKEMEQVIADF